MVNSPLVLGKQQAKLKEVARLLPKAARRKFQFYLLVQVSLNLLDIVSVAIMGAIGALAITGIQSKPSGNKVQRVLEITHLNNLSFQAQIAYLGIAAVTLMIVKVLLQYTFNRNIFNLLFDFSVKLSASLLRDGLEKQTKSQSRHSYHEYQHAIGYGVNATIIGTLGILATLISDIFLLVLISSLVAVVDLTSFLVCFVFFGTLSFILFKKQNNRAYLLGKSQSELNVAGNTQLENIFLSYREIYLNRKQSYFIDKATELRLKYRDVYILQLLIPNIGKYAVEVSIAVATLGMAAFQFSTQNVVHAAANLTIFLAAGSRIAPALLRVQNGLITLKGNLGQVAPTMELILQIEEFQCPDSDQTQKELPEFIPCISIANLEFNYAGSREFKLVVPDLLIEPGQKVAIIGKSGSGKTTLVDLILGLRLPQSGKCQISGIAAREAVLNWPGRIAYVPQHVEIFTGSIAENIAIGENRGNIDALRVIEVLKLVDLYQEIIQSDENIWQNVGSKLNSLSGGQRQRLGIARALYQNPSILVLDEATSSLDGDSEHTISVILESLHNKVTVIAIAHRVNTIASSDKILFMEDGRILLSGTFEELRDALGNDFAKARILGNSKN